MALIIVQPAGNTRNYEKTAQTGVSRMDLDPYLSRTDAAVLDVSGVGERLAVWAFPKFANGHGEKHWGKIEPGNIGLFYHDQKFFSAAEVVHKCHNPVLGEALWGKGEAGKLWEFVYFLRIPTQISLACEDFKVAAGYPSYRKWHPMQTMVLSKTKSEAVLSVVRSRLNSVESDDVRNCLAILKGASGIGFGTMAE